MNLTINFEMGELAAWPPENVAAFLNGIAKCVSAKRIVSP